MVGLEHSRLLSLAESAARDLGTDVRVSSGEIQGVGRLAEFHVRDDVVERLWEWLRMRGQDLRSCPLIIDSWPLLESWEPMRCIDEPDAATVLSSVERVDTRSLLWERAEFRLGMEEPVVDIASLFVDEQAEAALPSGFWVQPERRTALVEHAFQQIPGMINRDGQFTVALVPVDEPWKLLAALGWNDGGALRCSQHTAVLRHFQRTYGAELACLCPDRNDLMLKLASPISMPTTAVRASIERLGYGDDVFGAKHYQPRQIGSLASATMTDTVWGFWWD